MSNQVLSLRFLSEEELIAAGVLEMSSCVETIEEVFALVARGDYLMGGANHNDHGLMMWFPKTAKFPNMPVAGPDRRFMSMVAYLGGDFNVVGEKWYGSNVENRERGLPRSIHTITLNDVETGAPIAFMSGNLISAMRTGAVAGVAARFLAPAGAESVAIIGAGVISGACARAISYAIPDIGEVRIFDLDVERANLLASELQRENPVQVRVVESTQAAIEGADVISVATSGKVAPKIDQQWIKPGALLALTGNTSIADSFYQKNRIVVDNWAMHAALYQDALAHPDGIASIASWAMSADLLQLLHSKKISEGVIENLGTFVAGAARRTTGGSSTVFISGGMPVEDVAWAYRMYRNALEQDLGQALKLWDRPHWA